MMPERQCVGCTRQEALGCNAELITPATATTAAVWENPGHIPMTFDGEDTFACPRQHLNRNPMYWAYALKYYGMYKKGFLPQVGAIADQANKAMEVFRILDNANSECDAAQHEKATKPKGDPLNHGR